VTIAVILLLVIVLAAFLVKAKKSGALSKDDIAWPFQAKKPLSEPEQELYFRLRQALPDQVVLAQVQLSQFLAVKKGHNQQSWRNRINRMSADFVICAKDASVLAVIELDDATHTRADRKQADAKKDKAVAAAGIRILRWSVKAIPDVASIRSQLLPVH